LLPIPWTNVEIILKIKLIVGARLAVLYALFACAASAQTNPLPLINQPLVPTAAVPGRPSFTLTVNGTAFVSGSLVNWNGTVLTTTFVNTSQLTATVPASNIVTAGTASVTVLNPGPGGGRSNAAFFQVSSPVSQLAFADFQLNVSSSINALPTVADFNGDGKLDIAVLGNTALLILLGNGDGTFQAPVSVAEFAQEGDLATGDFNGDGKLDLAVTQPGSVVAVLLGNGDGTFQPQVTFATASMPFSIVVGDFNGDGKLDIATANGGGGPGSVSILLGNGDGTFQNHVDYAKGAAPVSLATGDFNGDGKLDIAYLDFGGKISILLGNGDGAFIAGQSITTTASGLHLITADLNGDSKLDLVQVNPNSPVSNISILLGNGDGTFQSPVNYPVPAFAEAVIATDFDGDGKLDIATIDGAQSSNATTAVLSVLLGNGDGTFRSHTDFQTNGGLAGLVAGDFNTDGKTDVLVAGTPSAILLQGLFPAANVSSSSIVFGTQAIGTTSPAQMVTLTNTGTTTLDVSNINLTGVSAGEFAQTSTCGPTLATGANCQVSVTFTPTMAGTAPTASLNIADNALGSPHVVILTGATPPAPVAVLSPASITFPSQYVGTSGLPQTVTVTNTGTAPLTIGSVNTSAADFGTLNACGSSVAAGSSCAIGVFFDPTATGSRTGTLTITDNAGGSPQTVSLSGTGQDFSITVSASTTATVTPGQTANYTVSVAPGGGFNQTVALTCSGAPPLSTCALSSSSALLNGSSPATVTVTVTTTARSSAGLTHPFGGAPEDSKDRLWLALSVTLAPMMSVTLAGWHRKVGPRLHSGLAFLFLLSIVIILSACGGRSSSSGNGGGTQAGSYNLTVTGSFTSGSTTLTHTAKLTLVVQ
jgi:hypothetical protein